MKIKLYKNQKKTTKELNEHYITPISIDDRMKYAQEVFDLLFDSYKDIGGLFGINDPEDLVKQSTIWKLVRRNGKITAALIYADKGHGRKAIAGGTNGTPQGKNDFYNIIKEDIKMSDRHAYAEASGAPEHIYSKYGGVPIPNTEVHKILGPNKKILSLNPDGYHYSRAIGTDNIVTEKIMFGFPIY